MRPPQNAGGIGLPRHRIQHALYGFNEAPAKRGGGLANTHASAERWRSGFNEAPAKRGGDYVLQGVLGREREASMRPRKTRGGIRGRRRAETSHMSLQ